MANTIRELMNPNVVCMDVGTNLYDVAERMRDTDIGDVLVTEGDQLRGMATDRDIVVRAVAQRRDPGQVTLGEIASYDVVSAGPDETLTHAVELMREHALRRLPVCEDGRPVGVLSIGDLAVELDSDSALADISAARGNY